MTGNVANMEKFRKILEERGVTQKQLDVFIGRYASKINLAPRNVILSRDYLKKLFREDTMTDKVFIKGLEIIGLFPSEIEKIVNPE
jgi:hypothetical protein